MRARFIGDPRNGGEGPDLLTAQRVEFVKGEWTAVSASVANKLLSNNHFEVDTDGDDVPEPTIEEMRARLDALGVSYRPNAGLKRLTELLDEHQPAQG